ncbi:hypothetical protein RB195_009463 [Necator americanus]|uniref:Uncharacterized protein n=1 Tax=Necator americanus TaxID=51031 RepID=A0ABR1CWT4_NECAM
MLSLTEYDPQHFLQKNRHDTATYHVMTLFGMMCCPHFEGSFKAEIPASAAITASTLGTASVAQHCRLSIRGRCCKAATKQAVSRRVIAAEDRTLCCTDCGIMYDTVSLINFCIAI